MKAKEVAIPRAEKNRKLEAGSRRRTSNGQRN